MKFEKEVKEEFDDFELRKERRKQRFKNKKKDKKRFDSFEDKALGGKFDDEDDHWDEE